ncbi:energy-coupling factor transporter transmembrane component T family protein [Aliiroseovarius sp. YM-037]|uniref:energy-coupling factor transporter transmembrane component T family protein n=1 Tax=Aliiroseovarius sp. YM-037 TaxID=3341728 RepID=UPI003A810177
MISLTSPIETIFHRVPAGLKLIALCVFTVVIFQMESIGAHLGALGLVVALYLAGGLDFAVAGLRYLRPLWPFMLIIAVWHFVTGTPEAGAQIALRLTAAFGFANLVTMTTRLQDIIAVLRWVLTPLRRLGIKTQAVELAIALVVRFTPELARKGGLLVEAWRSRSPRRPGWRVVAPLALLAIDDADHVADALRARGGVR